MQAAASLSIEPFEVSRSRLRRTRHHGVCILNGVLVPVGQSLQRVDMVRGEGEECPGAADFASPASRMLTLTLSATV